MCDQVLCTQSIELNWKYSAFTPKHQKKKEEYCRCRSKTTFFMVRSMILLELPLHDYYGLSYEIAIRFCDSKANAINFM